MGKGCSDTYKVHSWDFDQEPEEVSIPHKELIGDTVSFICW